MPHKSECQLLKRINSLGWSSAMRLLLYYEDCLEHVQGCMKMSFGTHTVIKRPVDALYSIKVIALYNIQYLNCFSIQSFIYRKCLQQWLHSYYAVTVLPVVLIIFHVKPNSLNWLSWLKVTVTGYEYISITGSCIITLFTLELLENWRELTASNLYCWLWYACCTCLTSDRPSPSWEMRQM